MSNVVNLNKFRKAKAKAEKDGTAAANRQKHGRTKAEKVTDKASRDKDAATHDAHKLVTPDAGKDTPPEDKDPA